MGEPNEFELQLQADLKLLQDIAVMDWGNPEEAAYSVLMAEAFVAKIMLVDIPGTLYETLKSGVEAAWSTISNAFNPEGQSYVDPNGNSFSCIANADGSLALACSSVAAYETGSIATNFTGETLTQTVVSNVNGQNVNVTYTYDANGTHIAHVNTINGQPPLDQASADAAFNQTNPGQLASGELAGTGVADAVAANDAVHPNGAQQLKKTIPTVIDALTFIDAIRRGEPLPMTTSGLRLLGTINENKNLNGASGIINGLSSIYNMHDAFKHGDAGTGILAGAQAASAISGAMVQITGNPNLTNTILNGNIAQDAAGNVTGHVGALAYLNLIYQIDHGNKDAAAVAAVDIILMEMGVASVPVIGWAVAIFGLVDALFSDHSQPEIWGNARAKWDGLNTVVQADGISTLYPPDPADPTWKWVNNPDGTRTRIQVASDVPAMSEADDKGLNVAKQTYQGMLTSLNSILTKMEEANPSFPLGIVANRMPSITYRYYSGYQLTDIDPLTGQQVHPEMSYDLSGRPIDGPIGTELGSWTFGQRFIYSAMARGAIAPEWEVQTAAMQTLAGDPMAGITEEERAGRANKLAVPLTASDTEQKFRPVGLDLNGDGVQTTGATKTVAWNVDDSGFLKSTAWLDNNDGFLVLDRNMNGQIDGGRELFSNSVVGLSERGLKGMQWVDANYDGKITSADPVWNELKIWQDVNGDGVSFIDTNGNGRMDAGEPNELQTLAQLNITELNYSMGTFTQNGVIKELASPDLAADAQGSRTTFVPEGILVQTSQGETSLIVTQVDDRSNLVANQDGVTSYEDIETVILADSLLANDSLGGISGSNPLAQSYLRVSSFSSIDGQTHGSLTQDANGNFHFKPDPNYFGEAQFNYTLEAVVGGVVTATATATVVLNVQNVNDAPVVTIDQHTQPIYGYDAITKTKYLGDGEWTTYTVPGLGAPRLSPYTG
jgi:hypothetical protein